MIKVLAREAYEGDIPFIFDAWMKTMRCVMPFKALSSQVFNKGAKAKVQGLLSKPQTETFVLCNPEDTTQLYSFIVLERKGDVPIIHFAYTKSLYWRLGLMKKLISEVCPEAEIGAVYTCFTPALFADEWSTRGQTFAQYLEKEYGMIFNPFLEQL